MPQLKLSSENNTASHNEKAVAKLCTNYHPLTLVKPNSPIRITFARKNPKTSLALGLCGISLPPWSQLVDINEVNAGGNISIETGFITDSLQKTIGESQGDLHTAC